MNFTKQVLVILSLSFLPILSTIAKDNQSVLEVYKNSEIGFEIKHPKSWVIGEDSNTSVSLRKFAKSKNQVVYISFNLQRNLNQDNLSVKNWYQKALQRYITNGAKIPNSIDTTLAGTPSVLIKKTRNLGHSYSYYIALNKDIFSISFYPDEDTEDDINEIISTIKFYE